MNNVETIPIVCGCDDCRAEEGREARITALTARCADLAAALRLALADVDGKAMSTFEQQAQRRAARRLLEET